MRAALVLFGLFSLLTGVIYPAGVTLLAQLAFPRQANGSAVVDGAGRTVGSELLGQPFTAPGHFWSRPSATSPSAYDAAGSGGSNLGPTSEALRTAVGARIAALASSAPVPDATGLGSTGAGTPASGSTRSGTTASRSAVAVPVDLVTASASGLDPHISPEAAYFQVPRVARARGIAEAELRRLVAAHVEGRTLGVLGEPRVNVLQLNRALDAE